MADTTPSDRLKRQIEFILEVDKAKQVIRRNYLVDGSRRESDGEHMWYLSLMAMTLAEWGARGTAGIQVGADGESEVGARGTAGPQDGAGILDTPAASGEDTSGMSGKGASGTAGGESEAAAGGSGVSDTSGELDLLQVMRMLLIHDLVEIDAGDTFAYDAAAEVDKLERETRAAERIFGLLPGDQAGQFRGLWDEFEARETAEARFANALDRLAPVLMNVTSGGRLYREAGITADRVLARVASIEEGSAELWAFVKDLVERADADGLFDAEAP